MPALNSTAKTPSASATNTTIDIVMQGEQKGWRAVNHREKCASEQQTSCIMATHQSNCNTLNTQSRARFVFLFLCSGVCGSAETRPCDYVVACKGTLFKARTRFNLYTMQRLQTSIRREHRIILLEEFLCFSHHALII